MKKIIFALISISFMSPLYSFSQDLKGIDKNLENISGQYVLSVLHTIG